MAKRDLTVKVGAETDDASFKRTEQKTRGFMNRINGGGAGGAGDGNRFQSSLDRTARATETLAKMQGIVMLLDQIAVGVEGVMVGFDAFSSRANGDLVAFDNNIVKLRDTLNQSALGAAGNAIGERIFGDQADADAIAERGERMQKLNDANRKRQEEATKRLLTAQQRDREEARLHGLEGVELEIERSRIAHEARVAELESIREVFKLRSQQAQVEQLIADLRARQADEEARIRQRVAGATTSGGGATRSVGGPATTGGRLMTGAAQSGQARLAAIAAEADKKRAKEAREAREQREQLQNLLADAIANPNNNLGGLLQ